MTGTINNGNGQVVGFRELHLGNSRRGIKLSCNRDATWPDTCYVNEGDFEKLFFVFYPFFIDPHEGSSETQCKGYKTKVKNAVYNVYQNLAETYAGWNCLTRSLRLGKKGCVWQRMAECP